MTALNKDQVLRLRRAEEVLASAWAAPDPLRAVGAALRGAFPGSEPGLIDWVGETRDIVVARGVDVALEERFKQLPYLKKGLARQIRPYDPSRQDRTANRFVEARDYARQEPSLARGYAVFREAALDPLGIGPFLRCPIYKGGSLVVFVALTRPRGDSEFSEGDVALANHLVPTLAEGLHARKCIDAKALAAGDLQSIVNGLDVPAFVIAPGGQVVLANDLARVSFPSYPGWISACGTEGFRAPNWVKCIALTIDGAKFHLLLVDGLGFDPSEAHLAPWALRARLPRRHAAVAACVLRGLSDKQSAERLGLKLNTVRTYMQQVLGRLGVHSRAELLAAVTRFRPQ